MAAAFMQGPVCIGCIITQEMQPDLVADIVQLQPAAAGDDIQLQVGQGIV
jgi:hypothetical protein